MRLSRVALVVSLGLLLYGCAGGGSKPPKDAKDIEEDPRMQMRLGDSAASRDEWSEALGYYRKSLSLDPNNSLAHNKLGLCHLALGDLSDAEISFREAIRINPRFADAMNNLGMALARLGDREGAKEQFRKAAETPGYSTPHTALYNLGKLQLEDGDCKSAVDSFRRAFDARSDFLAAGLGLGIALQRCSRLREACAHFENLTKSFPDNCDSLYYHATCLYEQKLYNDAGLAFDKVIAACPGADVASKANEYLKALRGQ